MAKNIDSASSKDNFGRAPRIQTGGGSMASEPAKRSQSVDLGQNQPLGKVNLLKISGQKKTGRFFKWFLIFLLAIVLSLSILVVSRASSLSNKIFSGQTTTFFGKVWEAIRGLSGNVTLKGENEGQINILLLGIGGAGHDGPYLTDTIILAQVRPQTSEVTLVSVPRDLLAELPNNLGERKINAVFAEGINRTKDWNESGRWIRMAVERLSGQTIPYFAVIDFSGFERAIDEVGGLDINVDRAFDDFTYPVAGKEDAENEWERYEHLHFDQGLRHMDGSLALKFTRSRHGNNNEGSDFSRSQRQQKVIKAFKDKMLKLNLITSAGTINNLLGIFADNFHTNLTPGEIFRLYDIVKTRNIQSFLSLSLDPQTGLVCPTSSETNGYILVPCEGKTSLDIQNYFKNASAIGRLSEEKSVIWFGDSTRDEAKYKKAESQLLETNLTVWQLNYEKDDLPETIVYQVNPKPATLEFVKNTLSAKEVTLPPPGVKVDPSKVDLIIILGKK